MIAHLDGTVAGIGLDGAVIEVGGVGLRVHCTPDTLTTLKPGERARVATSLVVREDSLTLFGFATVMRDPTEKQALYLKGIFDELLIDPAFVRYAKNLKRETNHG